MKNYLHIFNGDCTADLAKRAGIQGTYFVWRELLCQGSCAYEIRSDRFIETRIRYFVQENYASPSKYRNAFSSQFALLDHSYDEIVLWFEHDLFCQINMLGVISLLHQEKVKSPVSLICVGDSPSQKRRVGLGEIIADEYANLLEARVPLNSEKLQFADSAWKYYCEDMIRFDAIEHIPDVFPYLADTIRNNRLRFPILGSTFSVLETNILRWIETEDHTKKTLIAFMLRQYNDLGYGDLQYSKLIESLSLLFIENDDKNLILNTLGKGSISKTYNTAFHQLNKGKSNPTWAKYAYDIDNEKLTVVGLSPETEY